jgi:hypothetical protein
MLLKCGRDEFDLTDKDSIFFNGVVYILMTRKVGSGYRSYSPTVSKTKMKQLIKSGEIVLIKENLEYVTSDGEEMWYRYYKIKD